MQSLPHLAVTVQADRERVIRDQAPAPAGRPMALVHPVRPDAAERAGANPRTGAAAPARG